MAVFVVHSGSSSLTALQITAMVARRPGLRRLF